MWIVNIFFWFVAVMSHHSLNVSFSRAKMFNFIEASLSSFSFMDSAFGV